MVLNVSFSVSIQHKWRIPIHHNHLQLLRQPLSLRSLPLLLRNKWPSPAVWTSAQVPHNQICHLLILLARWVHPSTVLFFFFLTVQSHKTISLLMKMSPLCRNGPRHPGALRRHTQRPLHQRTWGRRRHRGSWLAELHHLHWNVLRCCRPPICLHLQRVPGEKEWSARWERWSLPLALVKFVDMFQS